MVHDPAPHGKESKHSNFFSLFVLTVLCQNVVLSTVSHVATPRFYSSSEWTPQSVALERAFSRFRVFTTIEESETSGV